MLSDERMLSFIESFHLGNAPFLEELENDAKKTNVPVIRSQMQELLKLMLLIKKPKRILEVGTAIGFSALLMAEYAPAECIITTIEKYEKRIPIARENFSKYDKHNKIKLIEGDAGNVLKELNEPFDLIFMDAAKGQYLNFLPDTVRLLSLEGILVSDNILQDGEILESRFAVTRRKRTIHSRMRQYLYELTHHAQLFTDILSVGDGVTISVKIKGAAENNE